jgi:hypothetical protein
MAEGARSQRAVLPSISEKRKVTVPVGSEAKGADSEEMTGNETDYRRRGAEELRMKNAEQRLPVDTPGLRLA